MKLVRTTDAANPKTWPCKRKWSIYTQKIIWSRKSKSDKGVMY